MTKAYLSIGSNIGDRMANLQSAIDALRSFDVSVLKISSVYETEPVGGVKQDDFLNIAVQVETSLSAYELLEVLHKIEQKLHRKRLIHWGPRTIDLDILYYANEQYHDDKLIVPHPEIKNRRFVLVPLLEIVDQDEKLTINAMLDATTDHNQIRKTNQFGGIK